jgi:gamma-glutamyl-gamma-aminobutyrate hydrolase PuuD
MKLGFCPIGNGESIRPFNKLFTDSVNIEQSMSGVDAVVFWGGTDIHPSLYGEQIGRYTQQKAAQPIYRDDFEWKAMNYCKLNKIPMIGVCRGAQLMTAFVGGTLIQHVSGHHHPHQMTTSDGRQLITTSCHHQMMYPYDVEHQLLAWTSDSLSTVYLNGENHAVENMYELKEPEVVYYPQVRGLAIQGHPEWVTDMDDPFVSYVLEKIEDLLIPSMAS